MRGLTFKWLGAMLGLCCSMAAVPSGAAPANDGFSERLLEAHNAERERRGVPRLEWSPQLAAQAQAWAATLARSNRFEHASDRSDAGENLWMGTAGYFTPEDMIDGFVEEGRMFRPGRFPDVSKTGNWADIGHYTQLIWRETREVGCAVASGGDSDILVCRYFPAGNMVGENVG